jgi:hypothetical protein
VYIYLLFVNLIFFINFLLKYNVETNLYISGFFILPEKYIWSIKWSAWKENLMLVCFASLIKERPFTSQVIHSELNAMLYVVDCA